MFFVFFIGNALYGFRLGGPKLCYDSIVPRRLGTPRLTLKFSQATSTAYKLILYAEFSEVLYINNLRNVVRNYQL